VSVVENAFLKDFDVDETVWQICGRRSTSASTTIFLPRCELSNDNNLIGKHQGKRQTHDCVAYLCDTDSRKIVEDQEKVMLSCAFNFSFALHEIANALYIFLTFLPEYAVVTNCD